MTRVAVMIPAYSWLHRRVALGCRAATRWLLVLGLVGCTQASAPGLAGHDWPIYLADKQSSQYSPLSQINTGNVHRLEVAWVYRTGGRWDPEFSQIQTNPLIVGGVLYGTSPSLDVFALDAATGEEIWRFNTAQETQVPLHPLGRFLGSSRGLVLWSAGPDKRLFFTYGPMLFALDPESGRLLPEFGDTGAVDLRHGLGRDVTGQYVGSNTPGIIYKDLLIQGTRLGEGLGSAPGHIRAYDVRTGAIVWTFHTIPWPGEQGYETWPKDAWQYAGGANNWAGMSLDESRGIVYVPTGSATADLWGGDRVGQDLFADCLIALDAATGKRIWHYQMVHHDIWDRDLPAPPNLLTVRHEGRSVDAVAQVTKSGHVFLFDRVTGAPLFPVEERKVPPSKLKGEEAWPTQPFPVRPEPFARQEMTESDISDLNPEGRQDLIRGFRKLRSQGQFVPLDTDGVVVFPGFDGGAEWGGAAVDPEGVLYVNSNEVPWIGLLFDTTVAESVDGSVTKGEKTYLTYCAGCHGADRGGIPQQSTPPLLGLAGKNTPELIEQIVRQGGGFMPSFRFLPKGDMDALIAFLLERPDAPPDRGSEGLEGRADPAATPYAFVGFNRFLDGKGYPAIKPPWGTLNAIDLNTGDYLWRIPLGTYPELTARGIPATGTENYGGPVVTGGGLVFIGATRDPKFRAFDKRSGKQLWETRLPASGFATPSTYMVNGRQYVVIAAGGGKLGQPSGDYYIAFALPPVH